MLYSTTALIFARASALEKQVYEKWKHSHKLCKWSNMETGQNNTVKSTTTVHHLYADFKVAMEAN